MPTITPNKTIQADLYSISTGSVAIAGTSRVGAAFDYSTKVDGVALVRIGRMSPNSTDIGARIRIETSNATSGNDSWFPIRYQGYDGQFSYYIETRSAAVASENVTGTASIGDQTINIADSTGFYPGNAIFFKNPTLANSEFARIYAVNPTTIIIEDGLKYSQTGSTIYNGAEIYEPITIPQATMRIRAVADSSSSTEDRAVQVSLITVDSFTLT